MFSSLFTWTSLCLCLTCLIVEFKLKFEFVLFAIQKSINKFFPNSAQTLHKQFDINICIFRKMNH